MPIELACAIAANELKLPVPHGVAVLAKKDQLPGLPGFAKPLPGSDDYLCFGSALQWPDDSVARLQGDDLIADDFVWRQLCDGPSAAPGAAWDELSANADRHTGNLLFDGAKFWLIDHELALQPIAKVMRDFAKQAVRQELISHRAKANHVAAQLTKRRPNDHGILQQPSRFSSAQARLNLTADRLRGWTTGYAQVDVVWQSTEIVLRGIALRLPNLASLLNQRLNVAEARSLWNSSNSSSQS